MIKNPLIRVEILKKKPLIDWMKNREKSKYYTVKTRYNYTVKTTEKIPLQFFALIFSFLTTTKDISKRVSISAVFKILYPVKQTLRFPQKFTKTDGEILVNRQC